MTSISELLRHQLQFTTWAANRILTAVAALTPDELTQDFKTSEKTILATLVHCYRAERVWLKRLQGEKADFKIEGDDTLAALQTNWPALRTEWSTWGQTLTDEKASAGFSYSDLKGNPWTQPVWMLVQQVTNHSSHHRGQAVGFIRALGHTPPNVDFITFAREIS